jgi:hypothetical protein
MGAWPRNAGSRAVSTKRSDRQRWLALPDAPAAVKRATYAALAQLVEHRIRNVLAAPKFSQKLQLFQGFNGSCCCIEIPIQLFRAQIRSEIRLKSGQHDQA